MSCFVKYDESIRWELNFEATFQIYTFSTKFLKLFQGQPIFFLNIKGEKVVENQIVTYICLCV